MIITKLQGGLGNQLFQFCYGKYLSLTYNTELFLDINHYTNQIGVTLRNFELHKFPNLKYNVTPTPNGKNTVQIEDDFNYKKLDYNDQYNYYLNGFWQSEKYFQKIGELLKKELQPKEEVFKKFLNLPINSNNTSLHVRRSDYVSSKGFHPVQTMDYYKNSLDLINDYDNLFVFSDDINWCKENLKFDNIIFIEGYDNVEDLWLMSLCKNNIIVNSSFSWWGAWLNKNPSKKVVAPKQWFGEHVNLNTKDIIPNEWTII